MFFAALLNLALLTSDMIPETDKEDDKLLIEALSEHDIHARSVDWRSFDVRSDFDAVLVFSAWDYYQDILKFLDLVHSIENDGIKVYNPPSLIDRNSSKKYLAELATLGLKTIETVYLSQDELKNLKSAVTEKGWNECVVKPQISADGYHTYRFNLCNLESIQNILENNNEPVMVQPFAEEIIAEGEWSFVFFNREYLHCILKKPLPGHFRVQRGTKTPIQPPEWMLDEVLRINDIINLFFAHEEDIQRRIDLIRRENELIIMEVEMIEPSLYLSYFPGSEKVVAKKIKERLDRDRITKYTRD